MTDAWNGRDFVHWIEQVGAAMEAAKAELNALDSALGDGDHGEALSAAFVDAAQKAAALADPTPTTVLQASAQSLFNRMGGASGALYGTFFLRMSAALKTRDEIALADWHEALTAGLAGVQARGGAAPGDKTMVDALAPAVAALGSAQTLTEGLAAAASAAQAGAEATTGMVAKFGRAKFAGERAIGHVDAGARSIAILFRVLDEFWEGQHGEG
ncbi:MAG: dihydroxyacetone kinase subunit L [Chloroflexi bacterium]|uniref:dihydroxyacetone kinase subunit DhaL n=1 Tax=Candidatus Flexifilum breve TaxID=3140694 RepID=UPI0031352AF1|nr:dihydroxyacetone kinase subunit L [Chloroflexota bacterium]